MARKTPFRQLSKAQQARYRRLARELGLTVRQVRASTELSQRARGHRAPAGQTEHAARRQKEETRARVEGRLTSEEVQEIRRYWIARAVAKGFTRAEGEATYKATIGAFREQPRQIWQDFRDMLDERNTSKMWMDYGRRPDATDDPAEINRRFINDMRDTLGVELDPVAANLFPVYPKAKPELRAAA